MDHESAAPLERALSRLSVTSSKSCRSSTIRHHRKRLTSQPSSSASSVAASDKSLTSFPSLDPESPDYGLGPTIPNAADSAASTAARSAKSPGAEQQQAAGIFRARSRPASIVESLTTTSPAGAGQRNSLSRANLFEDDGPGASSVKIPGALHYASDEHIGRLIARHGAAALVRQMAEDLARRDAQISSLRRRADERERALRKIARECGLSNLDLETRLRKVEAEAKAQRQKRSRRNAGGEADGAGGSEDSRLSDLMGDAMAEDSFGYPTGSKDANEATIRASSVATAALAATAAQAEAQTPKGTLRNLRDLFWGVNSGTRAETGRSVSVNGAARTPQSVIRTGPDRRPTLQDDFFRPPDGDLARSLTRAYGTSSSQGPGRSRKPFLANHLLQAVAAGAGGARDNEPRGQTGSADVAKTSMLADDSLPTLLTSCANTTASAHTMSQGGPKALMAMRRTNSQVLTVKDSGPARRLSDRWDTIGPSPGDDLVRRPENDGPVEMDTIHDPVEQPPTLTHLYSSHPGCEYLTDRYGFIYDQRRKKRQREAVQMARQLKNGARHEMLTGSSSMSPASTSTDDSASAGSDAPSLAEDGGNDAKPKRWQDYLKIAAYPVSAELLSHTPSISVPGFEVMEGGEMAPAIIAESRGFVPAKATVAVDSDAHPSTSATQQPSASGTLVKEDVEPVKLLLQQLGDLQDARQQERTVKWNDFLRKVRAERRREGERNAVAAATEAAARFQKCTVVMPETKLGDGELIGVASLGVQGKLGRAKAAEFRSLLLGGIPLVYRSKIWSECSGAKALRHPSYYQDLVGRSGEDDDPQVVSQITADITRTLTDNIFFRKGPGVDKLNELLLAYSRRNAQVGYCQGMNLVAANLLLIMPSAEDVFWVLVSIIEHILPPSYFDHSLLASRADQQVLRRYVTELLPRLSQHFEDLSIDLETMTFQWFLSVFTDCLSAEALFRVWDVVLCTPSDKGTFLFQVALALLSLNELQLLQCESPAAVYTYINHQMTNHQISIDGLIKASECLKRHVKKDDIVTRREKAIEAERDQVRLRESRLRERRARQSQKSAPSPPVLSGETVEASGSEYGEDAGSTGAGEANDRGRQKDLTLRSPMPMRKEGQSS